MPLLTLFPQLPGHAHLEGTLLPRGFFLGLGLIYLAALALDRLAERLKLPGAIAILLLGLAFPSGLLTQVQPFGLVEVETIVSTSLTIRTKPAEAGSEGSKNNDFSTW